MTRQMTRQARRLALGLSAATCLYACAVGPDFQKPPAPESVTYTRDAPDTPDAQAQVKTLPGSAAQQLHPNATIPREWWSLFGSTALDQMVEEALRRNASLVAAEAAMRQAQENAAAQRGFFLPSVTAGYSPSRQRNAVGTIAPTLSSGAPVYNLYTAQLTVGFTPDVFGGNRRAVESLDAQAGALREQARATALTLATNVVVSAIQEAALREQVGATEKLIGSEERTLTLLRQQQHAGYAAGIDVATQETALAQARAQLPPLKRALEQTRDLLAVLIGSAPSRKDLPEFTLAELHVPHDLPLSLPAQMVAQRPDVRAAEEQLHSASAQIGVAVAARWPQLSINGAWGGTSTQMSQLFSAGNIFWSIVGSASQSVFDGGTLMHHERAAQAGFDAASAQYQATVMAALQNVADTLYALSGDGELVDAATSAEQASVHLLELNQKQLAAGYVNSLAVFAAEQGYENALLTLAQARGNQLMDSAALFQALGGGWDDAAPSQSSPLEVQAQPQH